MVHNLLVYPQFCPSTLALISRVSPVPNCLYITALAPFGLNQFCELYVRTFVVHEGVSVWFILECRHGPFPLSISCNRKDVKPPQNLCSAGVHKSRLESGAPEIVFIISPSSELLIVHHFFFQGLIFLQETFHQNFRFFLNRLDWLKTGSVG